MPLDPDRADALEAEIARLRAFDLPSLQARWKAVTGKKAPPHLPKHLLLRLLAFRVQADVFGDLDKVTARFLDRDSGGGKKASVSVALQQSRTLKPGTLLRREWQGVLHSVSVVEHGFTWNGTSYRSMSEVARAITGTRWSGPRFFGLRQSS